MRRDLHEALSIFPKLSHGRLTERNVGSDVSRIPRVTATLDIQIPQSVQRSTLR